MAQLLLFAALVSADVKVPSTSLETLPVVYMGGTSAPRPEENIAMLAKMRYVVIEKWEGKCWNDCLANITKGLQCSSSCQGENNQMATLKAVKAINPAVAGIFYLNTILDFHFLNLHKLYVEADALIRNLDGSLCSLVNDNGMKNISAFDFSKEIGQQLWLEKIKNLTNTGLVDGFYGDTMQVYAVENNHTGNWELCKSSHHTCCTMNASTAAKYNAGKNKTMEAAYAFLGDSSVFFKTSNLLVNARRLTDPEAMNRTIQNTLAATKHYIHLGSDQTTDHDPHDISSTCTNDLIASFMLAVVEGAFLGCNGWDASFSKPLGKPLAPAQVASDGSMLRNFSSGTYVTWDPHARKGERGTVHWAGDPPVPTPTPAPPSPQPQPQPTAACPAVETSCGWQHANVGEPRRLGSWEECCSACHTQASCAKWVFQSDADGRCVFHGPEATHHTTGNATDGKVCGTTGTAA